VKRILFDMYMNEMTTHWNHIYSNRIEMMSQYLIHSCLQMTECICQTKIKIYSVNYIVLCTTVKNTFAYEYLH